MNTLIRTSYIHSLSSLLLQSLEGLTYPAPKKDIVQVAKQNGANSGVIETLTTMSDSNYFGIADIVDEITYREIDEEEDDGWL